MRLIVNGQQAFGKAVLEALIERAEHEIVAVYVAPDKPGGRTDPLKEAAVAHGLPLFQPKSFKDPAVWEQLKSHDADLMVMAYVLLFVPEEALNTPRYGSIQYHPSLLPLHRGPSSINWPIIQGSTRTGLTIFWPDNGLDTGPVLLQKETELREDDTLGSVYFDRLFPMGVEAMLEAIDLVRDGKAPRIAQDESRATYESWCRKEDAEVDWSRGGADVHNLIRGCNPQPGAWTLHNGEPLQIFDCRRAPGVSGTPGEIVETGADGVLVATGDDTAVLLQRVRPKGGDKVKAGEAAESLGLARGVRLGVA